MNSAVFSQVHAVFSQVQKIQSLTISDYISDSTWSEDSQNQRNNQTMKYKTVLYQGGLNKIKRWTKSSGVFIRHGVLFYVSMYKKMPRPKPLVMLSWEDIADKSIQMGFKFKAEDVIEIFNRIQRINWNSETDTYWNFISSKIEEYATEQNSRRKRNCY